MSWQRFARESPELAAAAQRLFVGSDGVAIGFLATAAEQGPHLSPVCPIFCDGELYLCASARTPKLRDLREDGRFALHAFLGANDEECQLRGHATLVEDTAERAAVHAAIPFASFDRADPIFRLDVASALHVYWEKVGEPDTRPVRQRWHATEHG